ncbi:tRNA(Glu)-specific nuclease WapA precursor [Ruminiclostridium hungatei]|uniref:tRNA(Glu)-specific nuclease WapA n=1 Tax=Ruminiclostridium hungatei TaxID=48256 RepID=A0A1V4SF52_RUMHU|nr:tRNA(Glu)-specific nuclease WapA precursor [Ruminiclostridium hungatei]
MYYLNARYYDSKIARFLSEDTYLGNAGDPLSLNLYTYCHNEPVMYVDPTGNTAANLNDLALASGANKNDIKWNGKDQKTGKSSATVTVNGITKPIIVGENGTYIKDNRIVIDNETFDKLFVNTQKNSNVVVSINTTVTNDKISATQTVKNGSYTVVQTNLSVQTNNYYKTTSVSSTINKGTNNPVEIKLSSWLYNYEQDSKKFTISTQITLAELTTEWFNAKSDKDRESIGHLLEAIKRNTDDDWIDRFAEQGLNNLFGGSLVGEVFRAGGFSEEQLFEVIEKLSDSKADYIYAKLSVYGTNNVMLNPNDINFSQNSAGGNGRYAKLKESMVKNGWDGPAIDIVKTQNGFTTIDNTRLAIARELGMEKIPVNIRTENEMLPESMIKEGRFASSKTWGEALKLRTGGQVPKLPYEGTSKMPKLPKINR